MLERPEFAVAYTEAMIEVELSTNEYALPLRVEDIVGIYKPGFSPEHKGNFLPAVDFAVADPRLKETEVLAPCDGIVVSGILNNDKWGEGGDFVKYLNWIHIRTMRGEFFELAHISPISRRILRVGDRVRKGEVIAVAGLNGRMTTTNGVVDAHIHMFVGKYKNGGYSGLRVRWAGV